ncbi:helix-turn-helix transcriptional regulator [Streptomyces caniscabiei]|uniref:helix-turn-helix domain-containing protein n=1 Tax=Streptomyces caniscabiei TaxID=2746961 RepID=UPI0029B5702F|nr:helix-turn-helix transcriptional regulator [Streptomyces caniscabiei]MDX3515890.1 helix-turn-helix transcriptional regulator [Streptomyces caniscabiei]MDX3725070.1 helix-turn-helix transcriptional regulator [Streptomyces caniscabiei]
MERNTSQDAASRAEALAERVRAARLPEPGERARIRSGAGVTLRDFAQTLGVSQMTMSRWERGEAEPRLEQRVAYALLLREVAAATTDGEKAS